MVSRNIKRMVRKGTKLACRLSNRQQPRKPRKDHEVQSVCDGLKQRFAAHEPLRTYPDLRSGRRLSIVTDSISPRQLYGGVGTAVLFGTLLANRIGADLRLITRHDAADPGQIGAILATFDIWPERTVECVHAPPLAGSDVPVFAGDLFLTTSWWTTAAIRSAVDPGRIIYLLQEDERMFYPRGDDRLRCSEVLGSPGFLFVVNSEILFRHFGQGQEPLPNVAQRGCWFEPAFPSTHYYDNSAMRLIRAKKNFLFYARPNDSRNMYWRGLEAIAGAVEDGILTPEQWDIIMVGRDLTPVSLPRNMEPKIVQNLPWKEYAALIRQVDVGLSLIDTPHPSYPPLDLAASGAVVVTNTCGIKTSLACYCENIVCADPSVDGLKDGIRRAVEIAADEDLRSANFARNAIIRDWPATLEPALRRCADWAR
jgi:hypothetical protein